MLKGIATGYEERFDFPASGLVPERPWLLASVPRSGSTYVSHTLWATGCVGAPLEYLNFAPSGPFGFASESPGRQTELWRSVLRTRTGPNGVFGLKAFPLQLQELHQYNPALMAEVMRLMFPSRERARVVDVRRRDRTAHAISYARASLSGVWRKEQESEGRDEPSYSLHAMSQAEQLIAHQEAAWQAMYRDLRIAPLTLWYEDVLSDPEAAVRAVASYLGVAIDPAAAVTVPTVERQSQAGAKAWAERHAGR